MPPISALPGLTLRLHTISPVSRSSTQKVPDFCPAPTSLRRSPLTVASNRIGLVPKSLSGLFGFEMVKMSPGVTWRVHLSAPVSRSRAKIESEFGAEASPVYVLPVVAKTIFAAASIDTVDHTEQPLNG